MAFSVELRSVQGVKRKPEPVITAPVVLNDWSEASVPVAFSKPIVALVPVCTVPDAAGVIVQ
jgi:hypothetical protein